MPKTTKKTTARSAARATRNTQGARKKGQVAKTRQPATPRKAAKKAARKPAGTAATTQGAKARLGKKASPAAKPAARPAARTAKATKVAKTREATRTRTSLPPEDVAGKKTAATKSAAPVTAVKAAKTKGGRSRKRRSTRREPRNYSPGELVLPGGAMNADEVLYFLRGCVAAEAPSGEAGIIEIASKRGEDAPLAAEELSEILDQVTERFDEGALEPQIPNRQPGGAKQSFASIVERARHRRREIGAFLRGLDLGGTETSHMDPHGEASLQNLMEWAARLEVLTEADQPAQTDCAPFHRVLDQLELNTEGLILDVEQTLRRQRRTS